MLLLDALKVVASRRLQYGEPSAFFEQLAHRWTITLGHPVTAAQVVLCMIDLKLARLRADPTHRDSQVDLVGYAALLSEITPNA